jgi:hypothetical protein
MAKRDQKAILVGGWAGFSSLFFLEEAVFSSEVRDSEAKESIPGTDLRDMVGDRVERKSGAWSPKHNLN